MFCQNCFCKKQIHICSRCKSGYYCSQECQKEDWNDHKAFCKLWNKPGTFYNLSYAPVVVTTPKKQPVLSIDDIYINYSRDYHGETNLHITVIEGNIERIIDLVKYKFAYINCIDWRLSTPFYYACSHSGKDNILDKNEWMRERIVKLLLDLGADPTKGSGFSGMTPIQISKFNNYKSLENIIINHKYYKIWLMVYKYFNQSTPPKNISKLVKRFHDLHWRAGSVHWLFSPARETMSSCTPHPSIVKHLDTEHLDDNIEAMFIDCYHRHKNLMEDFDEYLHKN